MAGLVAAEGLGSDGEPERAKKTRPRHARRSRGNANAASKKQKGGDDSDAQDGDYAATSGDSESSDDSESVNGGAVGNAELSAVLPSKSIPTTGRGSGAQSRKRKAAEVIEIEDEDSPRHLLARSSSPVDHTVILEEIPTSNEASTSSPGTKQTQNKQLATKNPIYYFYKSVEHGADGSVGEEGDKHYQCYHSNRKIFTLKKAGKSNLTAMVNNIREIFIR